MIENQSPKKKKGWAEWLLPAAIAGEGGNTQLDDTRKAKENARASKPAVVGGKRAHMEVQAVTGLAQQSMQVRAARFTARAFADNVLYWFILPFTYCFTRKLFSTVVKFGLAPAFAVFGVVYPNMTHDLGWMFNSVLIPLVAYYALQIYKWGVIVGVEPDDEREKRKQDEMIKKMKADYGEHKVKSIHTRSVLESNVDTKDHVKSALEAAEVVDSSWSKGEHTFAQLPKDLVATQVKPVPDVNKGFFELQEQHFQAAEAPKAVDIGNELADGVAGPLFTSKDYVFDQCDVIIDTLGLRLPAEMRPVRHTKTMSKRLLQVNKPLGTSRDLVTSFPIQIAVDFFTGAKEKDLNAALNLDGISGGGEEILEGISQKLTQIVCTLHIVNFVGKGELDRPENDSYLTLTQEKMAGGKKGSAGADLTRFKVKDEIVLDDLKMGDLWPYDASKKSAKQPKLASQAVADKCANLGDNQFLLESEIRWDELLDEVPDATEVVEEAGGRSSGMLASSGTMDFTEETAADIDPLAMSGCIWSKRPDDKARSGKRAVILEKRDRYVNGPRRGYKRILRGATSFFRLNFILCEVV